MKLEIIDGVVEEGKNRYGVGDVADFKEKDAERLIAMGVARPAMVPVKAEPTGPEAMTKDQLLEALHKMKVQASPAESKADLLAKYQKAKEGVN